VLLRHELAVSRNGVGHEALGQLLEGGVWVFIDFDEPRIRDLKVREAPRRQLMKKVDWVTTAAAYLSTDQMVDELAEPVHDLLSFTKVVTLFKAGADSARSQRSVRQR
jgi:hypothetical protein